MKRLTQSCAAAALLSALPSLLSAATAEEIWAEWQAMAAASGQGLTAEDVSQSGGVMTLSGLAATFTDGSANSTARLDQIKLIEQGDGSVRIELDGDFDIIADAEEDGETATVSLNLSHQGLDIVASGPADTRKYTYAAETLVLRLVELLVDEEPQPVQMTLSAAGLAAEYLFSGEDLSAMTSESKLNSLALALDAADPDGEGAAKIDYAASDLTFETEGQFGAMSSASDPSALFTSETPNLINMTHGGATYTMDVSEPNEQLSLAGSSTSGRFGMTMSNAGLTYDVGSADVSFQMIGSELPVPVAFTAGETAGSVSFPVLAGEDPQDIALSLRLGDVEPSPALWGLVDPQGALPQDPANLTLKLSGKATVFEDLMTLENPTQPPGQMEALAIDELALSAAGAALTGSGAFLVDNERSGLMPGAPQLVGTLNMSGSGIMGLLDNLVKLGAVSDDEAVGFRMMMGMIARPGEAPDSLVTEVELTEGGGVVVNGMQFR